MLPMCNLLKALESVGGAAAGVGVDVAAAAVCGWRGRAVEVNFVGGGDGARVDDSMLLFSMLKELFSMLKE
jgi:hypothetical protein